MDKTGYDYEKEALKDEIFFLKNGYHKPKPKEYTVKIVPIKEVVEEALKELKGLKRGI